MTEPTEAYKEYHQRVVAAIRERLFARWPPRDEVERKLMEANVRFFDQECSYEDEFTEGLDPMEMADEQIEAAI